MPGDGSAKTASALRCEECGTQAEGTARGQRAFLSDGEHEPEDSGHDAEREPAETGSPMPLPA